MPKKKKPPAEQPALWYILLDEDTYTEVTREATEDQWDADDLSHSTTYTGFRIVEKDCYKSLSLPFEPEQGITYYLVYGIYSTGDSFHYEDGCSHVVSLHKDVKEAEDVAAKLVKQYEGQKDFSTVPLTANGIHFDFYPPWLGYFESLTEIVVKPIQMNGGRFIPRQPWHSK